MTRAGEKIPVILLTGFLGSGKTTLLSAMLRHPDLADTAVVVNEIGTVGLDHHLVQNASEAVLVLENGCVCCSARDDLAAVLCDLFWDRLHRKIPRFSRVVIETSGVATPAPIAATITSIPLLAERFRLSRVVTTVDPLRIDQQLGAYGEATAQVLGADLIVITKPDMTDAAALLRVESLMRTLQPSADIVTASCGALSPHAMFPAPGTSSSLVTATPRHDAHASNHHPPHDNRIRQITVRIEHAPIQAVMVDGLTRLVCDPTAGLLRVKGIVRPADASDAMVIQATTAMLYPLAPITAGDWARGPGFLTLIGADTDFSAAHAGLDQVFGDGWRLLADGETLRPIETHQQETTNAS